jgi:O-antigen/teichoic acid export membrane protein
MTNSENSKRIAKNAGMLYVRMLLTMAVTLYTSRVVLNTLGVEDYGIYSVVGGFVSMFAFLNSAMASATQRFLSFEIGRSDQSRLSDVFSMSVNIHFVIAFVIFLFAETLGLWFVNTQLTLPVERMLAAHWVYQFSIFALLVSVVSVPYNALIIAQERMNVFAWVSVAEVCLKLLIVFMLQWFGFDKLKLYAVLVFSVALIVRLIYGLYCKRHFRESRFHWYWDKPLFMTLMSYAGWNLWGNSASVIMGQGVNVLLNIFYGPVVNAARGIAFQVKGSMYQFVGNFQMALNPQIIKSFAAGDLSYMHQLIFRGAKYSFFVIFALSLPVLFETSFILKLWLKVVPDHTVVFTRLIIINALIDSVSGPLMTAAQASGKIKLYQSVVGGLLILNLPISYLLLKLGFPPEVTLLVSIGISILALAVRLKIISPLVDLKIFDYLKAVVFRIVPVSLLAIIPSVFVYVSMAESFYRFLSIGMLSVVSLVLTIYFVGLDRSEQVFLLSKIKKYFAKV